MGASQINAQVNTAIAVSDASIAVNTPFTYTVDIICPSTTGTCTNAVVTVPFHSSLDYIGASPATGNVQSIVYNSGTNTVTITMVPTLNGTTDQVQLIVNFKQTTFTGTIAPATAYAGPGLTNPSNTVTTEALNGQVPPNFIEKIQISKTTGGNFSTLMPGGGVQYVLQFANKSQNNALTNFVMEDVFPSGFIFSGFGTFDHYVNAAAGALVHYNTYYKTNLNSTYTLWPGSPFATVASGVLPVSGLGLASGEIVTALKWEFIDAIPGTEFFSGTLGFLYGNLDNTAVPGSTLTNCLTASGDIGGSPAPVIDNGGATIGSGGTCYTYNVINAGVTVLFDKYRSPEKAGYIADDIIDYVIVMDNQGFSSEDLKNFKIVDMLPGELDYVSSTIETQGSGFSPSAAAVVAVTPTVTPDFKGSGKTNILWDFNGISLTHSFNFRAFRIHIKAKVKKGVPTGVVNNDAYFSPESGTFVKINGDNHNPPPNYTEVVDVDDIDGDGSTSNMINKVVHPVNIVFPVGAGLESIKWVKGSLDTDYSRFPNKGLTVPGGNVDYKLSITNKGNVAMKDILVIDILPFVGDKGVIDLNPRLTEWRPFLVAPVTSASPNVTVYYSTASNPCRNELTPGVPAVCTAPNWSVTPPADISTVQSLKFDFGATVLQPNDLVEFNWSMRAPIDAPDQGEVAWNSFGYITSRNDNGVSLLATEPIKVGIIIAPIEPAGYGNYVWFDENKNGLQDEPASKGINGVRVDLYKALGSTPNIATDEFLNFTLTSDKNGEPGYYQFTNLEPGSYYAVFHKPVGATYVATTPNVVSANDELDSDGVDLVPGDDALTITAIATIVAAQYDFRWDMGYSPATGVPMSIGSTVFVDKNNDGIHQATEAGISGLTVKLYFDANNNGSIDPSEFATPYETTTTDGNGNYLFQSIPDGKYIVGVTPNTTYPTSSTPTTTTDNQVDGDDNGIQTVSGAEALSPIITLAPGTEPTTTETETGLGGAQDNALIDNNGDMTIDFGFFVPMSIGSTVFIDKNNDGIHQATETGISGLTVKLYFDANNDGSISGAELTTPYQTTTTDGNGNYLFQSIPDGKYIVGVTPNTTYPTSSTPTTTTDNQVDGDDNGIQTASGAEALSPIITLAPGTEPTTTETETGIGGAQDNTLIDNNGDMTIDFGFYDPTALPIGLIYFKGAINDTAIQLTWKTADEKAFSHFEIQKSTNAKEFGTIGNVKGKNLGIYNFTDTQPTEGTNYYRLKMVDTDGSSKLSNIINVTFEKDGQFVSVENPAVNGEFKVNTNFVNPRFTLLSSLGRKIELSIIETGNNKFIIKALNTASGVYYLNISSANGISTKKILIP